MWLPRTYVCLSVAKGQPLNSLSYFHVEILNKTYSQNMSVTKTDWVRFILY
jgi:hypothetical protein